MWVGAVPYPKAKKLSSLLVWWGWLTSEVSKHKARSWCMYVLNYQDSWMCRFCIILLHTLRILLIYIYGNLMKITSCDKGQKRPENKWWLLADWGWKTANFCPFISNGCLQHLAFNDHNCDHKEIKSKRADSTPLQNLLKKYVLVTIIVLTQKSQLIVRYVPSFIYTQKRRYYKHFFRIYYLETNNFYAGLETTGLYMSNFLQARKNAILVTRCSSICALHL